MTCSVLARERARAVAKQCASIPIVTAADAIEPTADRPRWTVEVVVAAAVAPTAVLSELAAADLAVRDVSPQGPSIVVTAVV